MFDPRSDLTLSPPRSVVTVGDTATPLLVRSPLRRYAWLYHAGDETVYLGASSDASCVMPLPAGEQREFPAGSDTQWWFRVPSGNDQQIFLVEGFVKVP